MGSAPTRTALLAAGLVGWLADVAMACPSCKDSDGTEPFQWAIVLMIAGVFAIGGGVVFLCVRVAKQFDVDPEDVDANV